MAALDVKLLLNRDGSCRLEPTEESLKSFAFGGVIHLEGEPAEAPLTKEEEAAKLLLERQEREHAAKLARTDNDKKVRAKRAK